MVKADTTNTALVPAATAKVSKYPVTSRAEEYLPLTMTPQEFLETLEAETGSTSFDVNSIERMRYPSSEETFEITDSLMGGDPEELAALEVVIVGSVDRRYYWGPGEFNPNNKQKPVCSSDDAVVGHGAYGIDSELPAGENINPSGMCKTCPLSQWGSGKDGKGQACQLKADIYFLMPGSMTPNVMTLPVTSTTAFKNFRAKMLNKGLKLTGSVVRIKAVKPRDENNKKRNFSVAQFALVNVLPENEAAVMKTYALALRSTIMGKRGDDEIEVAETPKAIAPASTVDAETVTETAKVEDF